MLTLKIKNKDVEPSYNYRLYKNIAGADKDKRTTNFYDFLDGLFIDDPDTIIDFFKAAAGGDLGEDAIVDQLDNEGAFDDIRKTTDEILKGLATSGFLKSKVEAYKKYGNHVIDSMKATLEIDSLKPEDEETTQIQIYQAEEQMKNAENRMKVMKK
ncbi:hypothetical protein NBRC111452_1277 [Companilactobacillus farciminis]|uniref:hypothetical protein n=1 Tax=Companilactobacillus pabuli TaxID=2714036 RepID=UPI0006EE2BD8|nr:hypothetical protein NBRC111452_1277 [Companilactobacillus farciminis]